MYISIATLLTILVTACGSSGNHPAPSQADNGSEPQATLEIVSPRDNQTVVLPAPVRYRVVGLDSGMIVIEARGHVEAEPLEIPFHGSEGLVTLPADKFLTGHRDLTFRLATTDGQLLAARDVVHALTIEGGRSS